MLEDSRSLVEVVADETDAIVEPAAKPCSACPWVSTDQRDKDAVSDPATQKRMQEGAWFCCHVNMGTCQGAVLQHNKHLRKVNL